jgi:phage host-nuclease inhibitor protein Gam
MISTTENLAGGSDATREEAEDILLEYALAVNDKRKITAVQDGELLAVKNKYQDRITRCDERISDAHKRLAQYADTHAEIFPKDRKSVEWSAGKFGFRTDTPSLSPISRAFTWAKILGGIASKRMRKFVRIKTEVDKDAILARCGTLKKPTKFQQKVLPLLGLKLVQAENFYIEPDLTKVEVRS